MWIMLTTTLPPIEGGRPPKLSHFWSTLWPIVREPRRKTRGGRVYTRAVDPYDEASDERAALVWESMGIGFEPEWSGARKIRHLGRDLRVFPHEFTEAKAETMQLLIAEGALVPVADTVAEDQVIQAILDGETRPIYEAALLDGCDHAQAMLVAMGGEPSISEVEFPPPIGWYIARREVAEPFLRESEMAVWQEAWDEAVRHDERAPARS